MRTAWPTSPAPAPISQTKTFEPVHTPEQRNITLNANADIGVVGLAVMGQNLALNIADHGYSVAVHNRSPQRMVDLMERARAEHDVRAAETLEDLVVGVERPRKIILMVQAGAAVDNTIDQLAPLLDAGDVIIDGGNSYWEDTVRRGEGLAERFVHFVGAGVSGGEEGARFGPSIMPGGHPAAWPLIQPVLEAIAAKAGPNDDEPCTSWMGSGGAGHFVKMIHNGIEYGDMQVLAEASALLSGSGLAPAAQAKLFTGWNAGRLQSFLVEITAEILERTDTDGRPMVDVILDAAGQKGTGKWTVNSAMELGQPMMLVTEAVGARMVSSFVDLRAEVSEAYPDQLEAVAVDPSDIEAAIHAAKIISYAQGFMVLQSASDDHGWDLDLAAVARLWRGGCIIRAAFLDDMAAAFEEVADRNLLLADHFRGELAGAIPGLRTVVSAAIASGVAVPAMASALTFFDGIRRRRGTAALIQAQRDYFGAHTYERVDRPRGEFFHTDWADTGGNATSGSYSA